jgi:hypothetical protein
VIFPGLKFKEADRFSSSSERVKEGLLTLGERSIAI